MKPSTKSIAGKLAAIAMVAGMLALSTVVSISKDTMPTVVADWYAALEANDHAAFENLIDDGATIELRDLGVTQTKAEFIDSLDQWSELNGGATILTRVATIAEKEVAVEVCYRFSDNEVYNRETFTLVETPSGDKISGSLQEPVSANCTGF